MSGPSTANLARVRTFILDEWDDSDEMMAELLDAAEQRGANRAVGAERAAVVRYLRGEAAGALNILDVADDIESGEHIAKENA